MGMPEPNLKHGKAGQEMWMQAVSHYLGGKGDLRRGSVLLTRDWDGKTVSHRWLPLLLYNSWILARSLQSLTLLIPFNSPGWWDGTTPQPSTQKPVLHTMLLKQRLHGSCLDTSKETIGYFVLATEIILMVVMLFLNNYCLHLMLNILWSQ